MEFPTVFNWTSPFPILGLLGGILHFCSNFKRNFCKLTVENLIRRRILQRQIWFSTVWPCPTKRKLGLYDSYFDKGTLHTRCLGLFAYEESYAKQHRRQPHIKLISQFSKISKMQTLIFFKYLLIRNEFRTLWIQRIGEIHALF